MSSFLLRTLFTSLLVIGMMTAFYAQQPVGSGNPISRSAQVDSTSNEIIPTVSGLVVDSSRTPQVGVSVLIKGTSKGVTTDENGRFTLKSVPGQAILVIDAMGHHVEEVRVAGRKSFVVVLTKSDRILDQVIVTGYQTISKERATGSFAIVSSKDIEKKINFDATSVLEGQVAGVTTYGGDVVIRGRSTLSSNIGTSPLLVIDGLPTERALDDVNIEDIETFTILKDASASALYGSRAANGVIVITTKTAKRGQTFVNFSTNWRWTKNPSLGDYRYISTKTFTGFEQLNWERGRVGTQTTDDYVIAKNIGRGTSGAVSAGYVSPLMSLRIQLAEGSISQAEYNGAVEEMTQNDYRQEYMDQFWRTPLMQNYNLSISSSNDRQNTYASFNFGNDLQQLNTNKVQTFKTYLKSTQKVAKWLSVDLGLDVQYRKGTGVPTEYYSFDKMTSSIEPYNSSFTSSGARNYLPYTYDISSTTFMGSGVNTSFTPKLINELSGISAFDPMTFNLLDEMGDRNSSTSKGFNIRSFIKLNFQLYKGLRLTSSFDYELNKTDDELLLTGNSYLMRMMRNRFITEVPSGSGLFVKNIPDGGYLRQTSTSKNNYTLRNQLDYNTTVALKHKITALAGMEVRQTESLLPTKAQYFGYNPQTLSSVVLDNNTFTTKGAGYTSYIYRTVQRAGNLFDNSAALANGYILHRFVSFYAAGDYNYNKLYNFSASVRVDQTDLFGTDPKYRYRPLWSLGAGWNLHNEKFMQGIKWLDILTVRGSYGVTGNVDQSSSPYVLVNTGISSTVSQPFDYTTLTTTAPNPYLRWEKTSSYSLGTDFSFWKGLLSGTIEGYYKYSNDLLVNVTVPVSSGYGSGNVKVVTNNGAMSNRGVELMLSSPWFNKQGWKLTSTLVYSYNKNKIDRVSRRPNTANDLIVTPGSYYEKGKAYNSLYAYHFAGIKKDHSNNDYNGLPLMTKRDGTPIDTISNAGVLWASPTNSLIPGEAIYMGALDPLWNGSFTQGVQYKGFELTAMFVFYGGHKLRKPTYDLNVTGTQANGNLSSDVEKAWSPTNPDSNIPKPLILYPSSVTSATIMTISNYWRYSDVHVVSGNMMRLRNVALSYTLPTKYAKAAHLQNARLTLQANNIWYRSAAGDDVDPETYTNLSGGSKTRNAINRTLPTMPSYLLRLEITL